MFESMLYEVREAIDGHVGVGEKFGGLKKIEVWSSGFIQIPRHPFP